MSPRDRMVSGRRYFLLSCASSSSRFLVKNVKMSLELGLGLGLVLCLGLGFGFGLRLGLEFIKIFVLFKERRNIGEDFT